VHARRGQTPNHQRGDRLQNQTSRTGTGSDTTNRDTTNRDRLRHRTGTGSDADGGQTPKPRGGMPERQMSGTSSNAIISGDRLSPPPGSARGNWGTRNGDRLQRHPARELGDRLQHNSRQFSAQGSYNREWRAAPSQVPRCVAHFALPSPTGPDRPAQVEARLCEQTGQALTERGSSRQFVNARRYGSCSVAARRISLAP
jgi:hypothetical protein